MSRAEETAPEKCSKTGEEQNERLIGWNRAKFRPRVVQKRTERNGPVLVDRFSESNRPAHLPFLVFFGPSALIFCSSHCRDRRNFSTSTPTERHRLGRQTDRKEKRSSRIRCCDSIHRQKGERRRSRVIADCPQTGADLDSTRFCAVGLLGIGRN